MSGGAWAGLAAQHGGVVERQAVGALTHEEDELHEGSRHDRHLGLLVVHGCAWCLGRQSGCGCVCCVSAVGQVVA